MQSVETALNSLNKEPVENLRNVARAKFVAEARVFKVSYIARAQLNCCRYSHHGLRYNKAINRICFLVLSYILQKALETMLKNLRFLAIMLTKNKNPKSYTKSSPLKKAVHKLQIDFFISLGIRKVLCLLFSLNFNRNDS